MQRMLHHLLDGTLVLIRPIEPSDKPLLVEGLRRLSPEAAFRRFLSPKVRFSEAELRYLTEVDGHDHIALVAVQAEDRRTLIAVARCVRTTPGDTAELAIVVGDPWQGLGLGGILTQELARLARLEGIERMSGSMLAYNRPAFRLMRKSFVTPFEQDHFESGVREIVARLAA
jgi:acetyltransferase